MEWSQRSARVQVPEESLPQGLPPQNGLAFNIWYNKWSQGASSTLRTVSPWRLNIRDSGRTKADLTKDSWFCIYFARGMCTRGKNCTYKHHLPMHDGLIDTENVERDIFGRPKHASYREDMAGVGTYTTKNSTLYVGGIQGAIRGTQVSPAQVENRLKRLFGAWGRVSSIKYLPAKHCAFVRFQTVQDAEFAREASMNQALVFRDDPDNDDRTGLIVKWAKKPVQDLSESRNLQEYESNVQQTRIDEPLSLAEVLVERVRAKRRRLSAAH